LVLASFDLRFAWVGTTGCDDSTATLDADKDRFVPYLHGRGDLQLGARPAAWRAPNPYSPYLPARCVTKGGR
jgi:hypothetical protein